MLSSQNDPSLSLSRLLYCILLFGFLVVLCCLPFPSAAQMHWPKGTSGKAGAWIGSSAWQLWVTLCCWFPRELTSPLWSALGRLIYVCAGFQAVSLAPVSFPSRRAGVPVSAWPTSCLQGVPGAGSEAGALDHAARPWGSVLRTWTQPSLWVCLLVAANYNCKFALKIKFCLKSNFCLGAPL